MTQPQLIFHYILDHGSILPAKMGGEVWRGEMFGSESSKRCRELRAKKILMSEGAGRFERYYINPRLKHLKQINISMDYTNYLQEISHPSQVESKAEAQGALL